MFCLSLSLLIMRPSKNLETRTTCGTSMLVHIFKAMHRLDFSTYPFFHVQVVLGLRWLCIGGVCKASFVVECLTSLQTSGVL